MDPNSLFKIFDASFSPDPNVRIAAELELRKLEPAEGLLSTLLQLVSPASNYSTPVRLAAAIYIKNRVNSSWRDAPPPSVLATLSASSRYIDIPPSDRQALKTNILPLLAALAKDASGGAIKLQIAAVLGKVVDADFPEDWPGLVGEVASLLSSGEGEIEAGLRATVEILRTFRYSRKDPGSHILGDLVTHLFPRLLVLAQQIVAPLPADAASLQRQGALLQLVLKAYKNGIATVLPASLQVADSLIPWGTLFLTITTRELSPDLLPSDVDDREKHSWSKCKKWAVHSLNRLFMRYGSPSQLASNMKALYGDFADRFVKQFAPEILRTYLRLVERIVAGEWVASKVKHHMIVFFEECVKPIATWTLLKPHVQTLVEKFLFPLVCLSEDDIELFTEEPADFARSHFGDFVEESYANPTSTSLCFLTTLVDTRKKTSLLPLLNFIQGVVSRYPAEVSYIQKDGVLRMLNSLATTATKSKKLAPMLESFFVSFVLPEFKSPHGLLRYRACETVEKFESCDMDWQHKENIENLCASVMASIQDPELPVRIQAAITLPELVRYEDIRARMVPNVGPIMQELLKLSNEVDLDALTNTTRTLCSEFAEEVTPFAVELSQSLLASYSRVIRESLDAREKADQEDEYEGTFDDEKTLVCMNILKTVESLVSSLAKNPVSLARVEELIAPALLYTVQNNLVELYDETFEILDSLTFYSKSIGSSLWPLFEAAHQSFKSGGPDYYQEMFPFFDNVVAFGGDYLATNAHYRGLVVDLFSSAMTATELGAADRCTACKLGESMLLNMRGNIDEAIPPIVERSMHFVMNAGNAETDPDFVITVPLFLHSLELVITAVYYNPTLTLAILDRHQWTQQFFAQWFKHLSSYSRVHDRKLGIVAICALFEYISSSANAPLAQNASQLLVGALQLFKGFPEAVITREEYIKSLEESFEDEDEDDDEALEAFEDEEDEDAEEGDVQDATNEYLEMLARKQAEGGDDDDDTASNWSEEVTWVSPLDSFDMYERFSSTLQAIESGNPQLFQAATQPLTSDQRAQLQAVARGAQSGGEKGVVAALKNSST
ncbi:ARM repeat-containing protein [Meredithblackwellia eburnea MCA 4105]